MSKVLFTDADGDAFKLWPSEAGDENGPCLMVSASLVYINPDDARTLVNALEEFIAQAEREAAEAVAERARWTEAALALVPGTRVQVSEHPLYTADEPLEPEEADLIAGKIGVVAEHNGEPGANFGVGVGRVTLRLYAENRAIFAVHASSLTPLPDEPPTSPSTPELTNGEDWDAILAQYQVGDIVMVADPAGMTLPDKDGDIGGVNPNFFGQPAAVVSLAGLARVARVARVARLTQPEEWGQFIHPAYLRNLSLIRREDA